VRYEKQTDKGMGMATAISFNHTDGTARCSEHGDEPCGHMERLNRRLGLMAYHLEKMNGRVARGSYDDRQTRELGGTLGVPLAILASVLERPLADAPDERPL